MLFETSSILDQKIKSIHKNMLFFDMLFFIEIIKYDL